MSDYEIKPGNRYPENMDVILDNPDSLSVGDRLFKNGEAIAKISKIQDKNKIILCWLVPSELEGVESEFAVSPSVLDNGDDSLEFTLLEIKNKKRLIKEAVERDEEKKIHCFSKSELRVIIRRELIKNIKKYGLKTYKQFLDGVNTYEAAKDGNLYDKK